MSTKAAYQNSAQIPFSINNYATFEKLTTTPPIYYRTRKDLKLHITDTWDGGQSGGSLSTGTRLNEYGLKVGYMNITQPLSLSGTTVDCLFSLEKNGNQVLYSSLNEHGHVEQYTPIYPDISSGVFLTITEKDKIAPKRKDYKPEENNNNQYEVKENSHSLAGTPCTSASNSKTIPDTEAFSLLQNVHIYFTGDIYQKIGEEFKKIDSSLLNSYLSFGGIFALTDDPNKLYPDGVTTLLIKDGLSEGEAELTFDHHSTNKNVTITVTHHTSKTADIRDMREVGYPYPNTICFAM
ncbi:hypothetical protein [Pseudomonas sp. DWRC2-2]|uniref:hypothetical protein n=1 Tax=Pseudomonas sp. DWRC2-2 TaxID=2804567 RepID=UPI003CF72799